MKTLRLQRKKFLSAKRVPHTTNHCPWRCLAAKMFSKNSKIQIVANPKLKTLNNCWMDLGYFWMLLICQGPGFSSLKSCSCEALPVLQKHTHFLWDEGEKSDFSLVLKHQNLTLRLRIKEFDDKGESFEASTSQSIFVEPERGQN